MCPDTFMTCIDAGNAGWLVLSYLVVGFMGLAIGVGSA